MSPINLNPGALFAGLIFGGMGIFYFRIAKREGNLPLLMLALALLIYPYFVYNPYVCWAIGIALTVMAHRSIE